MSKDTWVASRFWLLSTASPLGTWIYKYLFVSLPCIFFSYLPRIGIAGSHHTSVLHFLRKLHRLHHFTLPPEHEVPVSPHLPALSFFKNHYSHLTRLRWCPLRSDLHCPGPGPGTKDVEPFFRVLADHLCILGEVSIQALWPFLSQILGFLLLLGFKSSLTYMQSTSCKMPG